MKHIPTIFLLSILFASCGDSYYGGYYYSGELNGTRDSKKERTQITLKTDSTIKIWWVGGKTYEFWERKGKYYFDADHKNIIIEFDDKKGPTKMQFKQGELTWQIIDSTSVYDKVISKFERTRLKAKKKSISNN